MTSADGDARRSGAARGRSALPARGCRCFISPARIAPAIWRRARGSRPAVRTVVVYRAAKADRLPARGARRAGAGRGSTACCISPGAASKAISIAAATWSGRRSRPCTIACRRGPPSRCGAPARRKFTSRAQPDEASLLALVTPQAAESNRLEWRHGQRKASSLGLPRRAPPPAADRDRPGGDRGSTGARAPSRRTRAAAADPVPPSRGRRHRCRRRNPTSSIPPPVPSADAAARARRRPSRRRPIRRAEPPPRPDSRRPAAARFRLAAGASSWPAAPASPARPAAC